MKILNSTFVTILAAASAANAFVPLSVKATGRSSAAMNTQRQLFNLFGTAAQSSKYPIMAEESVMSQKKHGTSDSPVQKDLRWSCDYETADRICNFNRHYAEYAGYWQTTDFIKSLKDEELPIKFYDSVTGKLLFQAPVGRSLEDFLKESQSHGWPSFRDQEVVWDDVRCLKDGECVSVSNLSKFPTTIKFAMQVRFTVHPCQCHSHYSCRILPLPLSHYFSSIDYWNTSWAQLARCQWKSVLCKYSLCDGVQFLPRVCLDKSTFSNLSVLLTDICNRSTSSRLLESQKSKNGTNIII